MCGINGIKLVNSGSRSDYHDLVNVMNKRLSHRGPDDEGCWNSSDQSCFLGHRRLSILDLSSAGHQPMLLDNLGITFNGEIFNHVDLRLNYLSDTKFRSQTDTETLIHMYRKFGENCLDYLNGMFAFAIWDQAEEKLFLARDHSGKKPLYYHWDKNIFSFSSELKALLCLPWISSELSKEGLYHFLTFNMVPPPMTLFRDLYKLEPGTKLVLGKKGIPDITQYWDISPQRASGISQEELVNEIRTRFNKSVSDRMLSDVPLGAFLSGGVDSSAVVSTMRKFSDAKIKTFSIGFKDQPDYDELKWARIVSKQFHTDHAEKIVSPQDIVDCLPRIMEAFDDPITDVANIPIYFVCQLAAEENIKVVLTGDGADELFAGYRNYMRYIQYYPYYKRFTRAPGIIQNFLIHSGHVLNLRDDWIEMMKRAKAGQEYFWGSAGSFKEGEKGQLINMEFFESDEQYDSSDIIKKYRGNFSRAFANIKQTKYLDWMTYIAYKFVSSNRFLMRMDKLGMQHSIEIRAPFLNKEIAELAMSVPPQLKLRNQEPKYILKKAFEDRLSREILYRRKQGFVVPIREWAGDYIADEVLSNMELVCNDMPILKKSAVLDIVDAVKSGDKQKVNNLWMIYFLTAWLKKWS